MIEPSNFDVIVLGTGLPESILAASIASSGKTVLHLDAYESYLSPWASLSFSQISSFASRGGSIPKPEFLAEELLISTLSPHPHSLLPSEASGIGAHENCTLIENASTADSTPQAEASFEEKPVKVPTQDPNFLLPSQDLGFGAEVENFSNGTFSTESSAPEPEVTFLEDKKGSSETTSDLKAKVLSQQLGFESQEERSAGSTATVGQPESSQLALNSVFTQPEGQGGSSSGAYCATDAVSSISPNPTFGPDTPSSPEAGFEAQEGNTSVEDDAHVSAGMERTDQQRGRDLGPELPETDYGVLEVKERGGLYSDVKVWTLDEAVLGRLNRYHLDLAGPKLAFCAGPLVDALLRAQADHHVRFKAVEASYIWRENELVVVPASRADIFRDRSLSLPDKRFLMRFFKLVTDYTESQDGTTAELAAGDLDRPFVELLRRQHLPSSIQAIILYAIALADEDQEQVMDATRLLSVRDGFQALALYMTSASRYPDAPGAFLYPMYGQGDLPQAFCRCAAVRGALYVLRMPVNSLLVDKDSGEYKGVKIATGQLLYSGKLISGPSFRSDPMPIPSRGTPTSSNQGQTEEDIARCVSSEGATTSSEVTDGNLESTKVARCICITDRSLRPGLSTVLVHFPPRALNNEASKVVRALQLGFTSDVCPDGKYVVQLSTVCLDATAGESSLKAAMDLLFHCDGKESEPMESSKPQLQWSVFYVQDAPQITQWAQMLGQGRRGLRVCDMPDGTLDYRTMMTSTEKIFNDLFPEQEFLPRPVAPASDAEDGEADDFDASDAL